MGKTLVAILTHRNSPVYEDRHNHSTYTVAKKLGLDVIFLEANTHKQGLHGDTLYHLGEDTYADVLDKMITLFHYVLDNGYDRVLKVDDDTDLRAIDNMLTTGDFVAAVYKQPSTAVVRHCVNRLYAADGDLDAIRHYLGDAEYTPSCAGAAYAVSSSLLAKVLPALEMVPCRFPEDVALTKEIMRLPSARHLPAPEGSTPMVRSRGMKSVIIPSYFEA